MNEETNTEKAALKSAEDKRELAKYLAARARALHESTQAPIPASINPRETRHTHVISRIEALELLQVEDPDFIRLVRSNVIRKAHPDKRQWYVFKDVYFLSGSEPFTKERARRENKLRLQNTCDYLSDFAPSAYYNADGELRPDLDMEEIDQEADISYKEGMSSMAPRFRALCRPVYGNEYRDHRTDRMVQYLYLVDDEVPKMTAALSMRRWYKEYHTHARYQVSRVTIPPLKALNRPEHQGVLRFLVKSAELLYGISFEAMAEEHYEAITAREMELSMNEASKYRLPLYDTLTGARVSDETDFAELLEQQGEQSVIPLDHTVAAWYQAYSHLITRKGKRPEFAVKRLGYVKSMLQSLVRKRTDSSLEMSPEEAMRLRLQIEKILGCQPGWASRYKPEAPPVYIGHPPCLPMTKFAKDDPQYNPDPLRVMIHPGITGMAMTGRSEHLLKQNSLEGVTEAHKAAAAWIIKALDEFHAAMSERVTLTSRTNVDRILMNQLFRELRALGVGPRSLYLHPYRDAERLMALLRGEDGSNLLMEVVLGNLKASDPNISIEKRSEIAQRDLEKREQLEIEAEAVAKALRESFQDVTHDMRLEYVLSYASEKMQYSPKDLRNITPEEIVSGLKTTGLDDLNLYIVNAQAEEATAEETILNLE